MSFPMIYFSFDSWLVLESYQDQSKEDDSSHVHFLSSLHAVFFSSNLYSVLHQASKALI